MRITEESMDEKWEKDGEETEQPLTEREKLRRMNTKDRFWYIWAYYKFHIGAVLLAVAVVTAIAQTAYRSSFQTVLHVIYLNSRSEQALDMKPLDEEFAKHLQLGRKEEIISEEAFLSTGENATEYSYASMAKISALSSAGDLDILIGDTESTDHYASLDVFGDLEQILPEDMKKLVEHKLYYAADESGKKYACAIDLTGTEFAEKSHLAQDKPLLGIVVNTKHSGTAVELIRYIFE